MDSANGPTLGTRGIHGEYKGLKADSIKDVVGVLSRHPRLRFPHPASRLQNFRSLSYQASAITSWQPQSFVLPDLGNGAARLHMDLCAGSVGTLNAHLH